MLADRVLRLLLAGSEPQQILCLTFTKAAAAEMVARVQADLGRFATLPDAALGDDLRHLLGRPATAGELANARSLLARVLDLPSGLPIMTIHGFCQSLLRRFPLEAGVPAHFDVIEPRTAADLMREAQEEVLASRQAAVQADLATLAVLLGESTLAEGLAELREQRLRSGADLGDAQAVGRSALPGARPAGGRHAGDGSRRGLRRSRDRPGALLAACRALEFGSDRDGERCALITAWLTADQSGRIEGFGDYETVFLRAGDRTPKAQSNVITSQAATPAAVDALMAEQERLAAWAEKAKAARVAERTAALLRVGSAVLERYAQRKARLAALDYDDLIERARDLLQDAGCGVLGAVQARPADRSSAGRRGPGHEPFAVGDHRGALGRVLRRQRRAPGGPHAVRGRRREAVDHERAGRGRRDLPAPAAEPSRPRRGRPAAVARGAAEPLVPLGAADPAGWSMRCSTRPMPATA